MVSDPSPAQNALTPPSRVQARLAANQTNRLRRQARKSGELITVAIPTSLKFATKTKQASLHALLREIRGCINRYIKICWKNPEAHLDAKTLNLDSGGMLSYRHRSNALRIALDTIKSTLKSASTLGKRASRPKLRADASVSLPNLVCKVEPGKGSFDYVIKVSGLVPREPILLPVKGHKHLNHWLKHGTLLHSVDISEGTVVLQVNVSLGAMKPVDITTVIGLDLGYLKLLSTSDGDFHGRKMKAVTDRVARCKPGSKGKLRARRARTHFINRQVNEIPWASLSVLGMEDLTGIKQGKGKKGSPKSSKSFRKKMAPWVHRQASMRIVFKAKVNRVHLVLNDPRNSARECPACGWVASENRKGEVFRCIRCNYTSDADTVGSLNMRNRTLQKLTGTYGACASSGSDTQPLVTEAVPVGWVEEFEAELREFSQPYRSCVAAS